ncbi:MAG: hypothetical protein H0W73_12365 [Bacteroidetes bacterium]|nr:hypothetical protein [Bacteroidota bacterium]
MKKVFKIVLVLTCTTSLFFVGCRKKETTEVDNETQSAVDNAVADQEYMSIVPATNGHAINTKGTGATNGRLMSPPACDTLAWLNRGTADTTLVNNKYLVPPEYELNLLSACPASFTDGKLRSGKWHIRITGPLKIVGSQMVLKLLNHKASGIGYACDSLVVTTVSSSTASSSYNIKLINGVCTSPNWTIKYSFDRTITNYVHGNPVNTDPVVEVFGSANGVNRLGKTFTVDIPAGSPMVKHKGCQFVDKGVLNLTPEGFKTRIVDFGNGTCDDDATFTVNGSTVAFKLK